MDELKEKLKDYKLLWELVVALDLAGIDYQIADGCPGLRIVSPNERHGVVDAVQCSTNSEQLSVMHKDEYHAFWDDEKMLNTQEAFFDFVKTRKNMLF